MNQSAYAIRVQIVGWHENYPPGIVECVLEDRFGKRWRVAVKQYDATDIDLAPDSKYPLPGMLACLVHARGRDREGHETAIIALDIPLENLTESGIEEFDVRTEQLA